VHPTDKLVGLTFWATL